MGMPGNQQQVFPSGCPSIHTSVYCVYCAYHLYWGYLHLSEGNVVPASINARHQPGFQCIVITHFIAPAVP